MCAEKAASASDNVDNGTDVWEKITYTWVIKHVDFRLPNASNNNIQSPTFYNKERNYRWCISFGLSEGNFSDSSYLEVYLRSVSQPQAKSKTKFSLSFKNSGDRVINKQTSEYFFTKSNEGYGFNKFVRWSALLLLLPDKILKIHAEVLMKIHTFEVENYVIIQGSDLPEVRLPKDMDYLFESSNFFDVIFEVEETQLKAHRCILSARSPVFAAMFTHESVEKKSGVVKMVDFETDNFKRFLRFVYTGKVDIPSIDAATELFRAAEKYDLPDLKLLCQNHMSANLNPTSLGPVLHLAETFGVEDLKKVAIDYMLENIEFYSNVEMEVYKFIEKENPKLLTELWIMAAQNFAKSKL